MVQGGGPHETPESPGLGDRDILRGGMRLCAARRSSASTSPANCCLISISASNPGPTTHSRCGSSISMKPRSPPSDNGRGRARISPAWWIACTSWVLPLSPSIWCFLKPTGCRPPALGGARTCARRWAPTSLARSTASCPIMMRSLLRRWPTATSCSALASCSGCGFVRLAKPDWPSRGLIPRGRFAGFAAAIGNIPVLQNRLAGLGAISISPQDNQGIVRQVPLVWSDGHDVFPSLALEALRVAQGGTNDPGQVHTGRARGGTFGPGRKFRNSNDTARRVSGVFQPGGPEAYVSIARLLHDPPNEALKPLIEGNIIFVGTSAVGLLDVRTTRWGKPYQA